MMLFRKSSLQLVLVWLMLVIQIVPVLGQTESEPPVLVIVSTDGTEVFVLPDDRGESIGQATDGEQLPITGMSEDGNYYRVDFEDQEGWIAITDDLLVEGDESAIPVIVTEVVSCTAQTDQKDFARLRVGPGINRTALVFLVADTEINVAGQNTDADGATWYALHKAEAAPDRSLVDDYVWVIAEEVETSGDCDQVPTIEGSTIIPIIPSANGAGLQSDVLARISVPGNPAWVDSGIQVVVGKQYRITASGVVNVWSGCESEKTGGSAYVNCALMRMGPNGGFSVVAQIPYLQGSLGEYPVPNAMLGALIARVGDGSWFVVGRNYMFTAQTSGTLSFIVNDSPQQDNSGVFVVEIRQVE